MTKPFESLDDALNVTPDEVLDLTTTEEETELAVPTSKDEDREEDYQYARNNLHSIIEKMQQTLDGALDVASESDHPRAFEVAFAGAKHLADVVDKLQDLHAKEKKMSEEQPQQAAGGVNNGTVNNVYMTGSTADLLKMLKQAKEEDK